MAYVYVLLSDAPARTYVGWTLDVDRRVRQHNAGAGARFTRGRRWTLVHVEACADAPGAMRRERALKRDRAFRAMLRAQGVGRTGL